MKLLERYKLIDTIVNNGSDGWRRINVSPRAVRARSYFFIDNRAPSIGSQVVMSWLFDYEREGLWRSS